jgi:ABC-type glycerol-3-phosphate transport system substrate-binding protein
MTHRIARQLSRREFLQALGVTAGASALAACVPPAAPPAAAPEAPQETPVEAEAPAEQPPAAEPLTLELWTFVNTHARWFESMGADYKTEKNPNFELKVSEIAYSDMHDKALIALQAGGVGAPDLLDLEQGRFGGFLRGTGDVGLVDLTDMLESGGYMDKLVAAREALYTYKGKTYGVEHALCPVVLYYRADAFEDAGIDVAAIETWDDFIAAAKPLAQGDVKAILFPEHDVILRSRKADHFDAEGNVTLDSDVSIATENWVLGLQNDAGIADAGPEGNGSKYSETWYGVLKEGKYLSVIGADWYAGFLKDNAPDLSGKWKATPLPAFEQGGTRTSCHGGTGNCIVKTSKNIDAAWDFMQYSMLSEEGNVRRFEMTNLFPPFIPAMGNARLHKPDEYFSGQDLGQLFADLGPTVPAQYQSPYRAELNSLLDPRWVDVYAGNVTPEEVFKEVSEEIRKVMAEEAA